MHRVKKILSLTSSLPLSLFTSRRVSTEESIATPGGLARTKASEHHCLCAVGKCGSTAAPMVVVKRISTTIKRDIASHLDSILMVSNACVWKYLKAIEYVLYIEACSTNNFIFFLVCSHSYSVRGNKLQEKYSFYSSASYKVNVFSLGIKKSRFHFDLKLQK